MATNPRSSTNKASDPVDKDAPTPAGLSGEKVDTNKDGEETEAQKKAREESEAAAKAQETENQKRKGNLAKAADGYDPYADPDVPSSQLADVIRDELETGESPTLKALREAKKEEEKKDNE